MAKMIKRKIVLPEETLKEKFLDKNGKLWTFGTRINGLFFPKTEILLKEDGELEERVLDELRNSCRLETQKWYAEYKKSVNPIISQFIEEFGRAFDFAFEAGEERFRKEYTNALAIKGKKIIAEMFAEFLEKLDQELLDCVEKDNDVQDSSILSLGPFPPATRFYWKLKKQKSTYEVFCFEFTPSKRTIDTKETGRYRVAFPWLCVFAAFKNGKFYSFGRNHEHDHCAFWMFYRKEAIKSSNDELFLPNLPNIFSEWPHFICLGRSLPVIKLSDPKWHTTLLNHFWNSAFDNSDDSQLWEFYREVVSRVPEIKTWEVWADLSKRNPNRVLELPWPNLGQTIETFAKKVMELIARKKGESERKQRQYKTEKMKNEINLLAKKYAEQLKEELYFLGSGLAIPIKSKEKLQNYVAQSADVLRGELETRIDQLLRKIAETATEKIKNGLQII